MVTARRTTCDRCHAEKQAEVEEQRRQAEDEGMAEARKVREAQLLELLARAGANPNEHGRATLANWDAAGATLAPVTAARQFLEEVRAAGKYEPVRGLYLYGGTGTGKTHLAVGVVRELLTDLTWRPESIVYDHAAELMSRIQSTYSGGNTFDLLERRFDARLWVLDDLGTERGSDDVARHLTLIFTRRAMRPTLVTSNLSPAEMERHRPELARVISRLGPSYYRHAKVAGRDRRFDGE
jgi:DNA replication protein DnaC